MKRVITFEDKNFLEEDLLIEKKESVSMSQVRVIDSLSYQNVLGMGGALTEAAAYVWSQMSPEKQEELINLYFSKEGSSYNFCRLHIQSCDFALGNYSYIEDSEDKELKTFSIERDKKYIIPLVKAALKVNPNIEFLASPWSPCPFMKTNGQMNNGGKLKLEYYQMWANVIAKYVETYRSEGINITRLTVQNEPAATQVWDSCVYTAEEERDFACKYLKEALCARGLSDVKINIWDHNKELLVERAIVSLGTDEAKEKIDGIAFHWYSGDHFESVKEVSKLFPNKELIFSEGCVEYSRDANGSQVSRAERYAHDIIGNFCNGMNGFIDWNIYLDYQGGPNHVKNFCDAPIMLNPETNEFEIHKSYYYIKHFSKFIQPGAKRIFMTRWSDKIESVAFKNPDGKKVIIVMNRTDSDENFSLCLKEGCVEVSSPAHSIQTILV